MTKTQIGHAEEIKAFSRGKILWLVARGSNPSTGWKNWFEPDKVESEFSFMQQPPDGIFAPIMIPFIVKSSFSLPTDDHVLVREIENGKPTTKRIHIERKLCPVEEATFAALTPHLVDMHALLKPKAPTTSYHLHLGSFDLPFGCASLPHPTRARHFDIYLEVNVAGVQDVQHAVEDCLKESAIVTALALILTPLGWAVGPATFVRLLQVCLSRKLKEILSVSVKAETHCA